MPPRIRAPDSYGSVLSFEDLELSDVNLLNNESILTTTLVEDARTVANEWKDVLIEETTVCVGRLFHALLDYAGRGILEGTNYTGERYTAMVINNAYKKKNIPQIAVTWLRGMLYPMKAAGAVRTAQPSTVSSAGIEELEFTVGPSTRVHQANLRPQLYTRHNYICPHHPIEVSMDAPRELQQGKILIGLEAAHILPFLLNNFSGTSTSEIKEATLTWTLIQNWTSRKIQSLFGDGINDITNVILLCPNEHDRFGKFRFRYEPIEGEKDCYFIRSNDPTDGSRISFKTSSIYPPPNPVYLAIHAAFAQVLYASGASEFFNNLFGRDWDRLRVMAADGSSDLKRLNLILKYPSPIPVL